MIKFRKANDEEKTVILNSLNQARKEKRWEIIKNAVPYLIFVVFVELLFWVATIAINKDTMVPKFKKERDRVLKEVYHIEYKDGGRCYFSLNTDLEKIDFDHPVSYYKHKNGQNMALELERQDITADNAERYDEVVDLFEDYYDEKYAEEKRALKKANTQATVVFAVVMVLTFGVVGVIVYLDRRSTQKEIKLIQNDQFEISERQVVGVFHKSRKMRAYQYDHYFFDLDDGHGGTVRIQVSESEYERFHAHAIAYLVNPECEKCIFGGKYEAVLKK